MGKIIAIGGGELREKETLSIDAAIVALANKDHPKALFLPTASMDAPAYIDTFHAVYASELGCETHALTVWKHDYVPSDLKNQILGADIIYVGGGNTQKMLAKWHDLGIDTLLKEAYTKDIVLSGLSAGAICWFDYGISDSPKFDDPNSKEFIKIEGLGLIKGTVSPHNLREGAARKPAIEHFAQEALPTFAISDKAALEINGGSYRILRSSQDAQVFQVYKTPRGIEWTAISTGEDTTYRDIKDLYQFEGRGKIESK